MQINWHSSYTVRQRFFLRQKTKNLNFTWIFCLLKYIPVFPVYDFLISFRIESQYPIEKVPFPAITLCVNTDPDEFQVMSLALNQVSLVSWYATSRSLSSYSHFTAEVSLQWRGRQSADAFRVLLTARKQSCQRVTSSRHISGRSWRHDR